MRIIVVANRKGGSGKTTTAVNLAATLAERERRVLLIDLDPQANASHWYACYSGEQDLLEVFTNDRKLEDIVCQTEIDGVDLIPSSEWLVGVEPALTGRINAQLVLKEKIKALPKKKWDYILLDCPPNLGLLTVNALSAAREVLIPVTAEYLSSEGLADILRAIHDVKKHLNRRLTICGILPCRVDNRTNHSKDMVKILREDMKELVYKTEVPQNVRLTEAPGQERPMPITIYASKSAGAEAYRSLAQEVVKQE